jgi:hypothetical protein
MYGGADRCSFMTSLAGAHNRHSQASINAIMSTRWRVRFTFGTTEETLDMSSSVHYLSPVLPIAKRALSLMLLGTASVGCYSSTEIKPTEIPKLNGGRRDLDAFDSKYTVMTVERPDGTLTKIEGASYVRLTLRNGAEVDFEPPVLAELEDDALNLRGANRPKTSVKLNEVSKAEVSNYSSVRTSLLLAGLGVLLGLVVVGVWVGSK